MHLPVPFAGILLPGPLAHSFLGASFDPTPSAPLHSNATQSSAHPHHFFLKKGLLQVGYTCKGQESNNGKELQGPPA